MALSERTRLGAELADPLGGFEVRDVDDQWVEARPALGFVNACDGRRIRGVGGKSVDRLGRHSDGIAGEDPLRGLGDRVVGE